MINLFNAWSVTLEREIYEFTTKDCINIFLDTGIPKNVWAFLTDYEGRVFYFLFAAFFSFIAIVYTEVKLKFFEGSYLMIIFFTLIGVIIICLIHGYVSCVLSFKFKVVQHQPVKYEIYPLSPLSLHRLSIVRKKVLVLDLDETLIHSHHDSNTRQVIKPGTPPDFVLKVTIERNPVRFLVHKRPHVDFFLDIVSQWYELVVFTASMEIYGAGVADKLDNNRGILNRRYYRQHCTPELGTYTKDLTAVTTDLTSIFILDNSPGAYRSYPDNAIPIKSWFSDPMDTALLNLLPVLDALRFTHDVRSVLSRNLHLQKIS